MATDILESVTIRQVANGWVVQSGKTSADMVHVAETPEGLGKWVVGWAAAAQRDGRAQDGAWGKAPAKGAAA
jgi:hypothetical protein